MYRLIIIFLFLLSNLDSKGQSFPYNDGKCYGESTVPEKYYFDNIKFPIYTGEDAQKYKFKKYKIPIRQARTITDSLGVQIIEEGEFLEIEYLKNPKKVPEGAWKYVEFKQELKKEKRFLIKEVLCEEEITSVFILNLRKVLKKKGFEINIHKESIDKELVYILIKYQLENNLAAGCLDVDTLTKLRFW